MIKKQRKETENNTEILNKILEYRDIKIDKSILTQWNSKKVFNEIYKKREEIRELLDNLRKDPEQLIILLNELFAILEEKDKELREVQLLADQEINIDFENIQRRK